MCDHCSNHEAETRRCIAYDEGGRRYDLCPACAAVHDAAQAAEFDDFKDEEPDIDWDFCESAIKPPFQAPRFREMTKREKDKLAAERAQSEAEWAAFDLDDIN